MNSPAGDRAGRLARVPVKRWHAPGRECCGGRGGDLMAKRYVEPEYRRDTAYISDRITRDAADGWPVQPGRYRLVAARACPWASRVIIVDVYKRQDKGTPRAPMPVGHWTRGGS